MPDARLLLIQSDRLAAWGSAPIGKPAGEGVCEPQPPAGALIAEGRLMWCAFCGRRDADCPGGVWLVGRHGREGICVYCARVALRALDPREAGPVVLPFPKLGVSSGWPSLDPDERDALLALGFEPIVVSARAV